MGIYDRDYYRKEGPSFLESFALRNQICKWLVIVNIAVYIMQLLTRNSGLVTEAFILVPEKVVHGEVWRLLTSAFLHDPDPDHWTHIVFNMWLLWLFGGYVEEIYGRWEFLAFYLTAAVMGSLAFTAQAALGWHLTMQTPALGASGAVTGVMILCAFHYPRLTILLFFVLPTPIWALAALQVAQDSLGLLGARPGARIGFSAHLGGAAFAALYFQMHWRLLSFWPKLRAWKKQRSRPRLRVFRGDEDGNREPVPVAVMPPAIDVDEQLEAKLDAVLEKVARTGQSSLSDAEKQILLRASEIYKKRRN